MSEPNTSRVREMDFDIVEDNEDEIVVPIEVTCISKRKRPSNQRKPMLQGHLCGSISIVWKIIEINVSVNIVDNNMNAKLRMRLVVYAVTCQDV